MKKKEISYIVSTIDGKQHKITVDEADAIMYDNYNFNFVIVDNYSQERINPYCIISIRKIV